MIIKTDCITIHKKDFITVKRILLLSLYLSDTVTLFWLKGVFGDDKLVNLFLLL